MKRLFDIIASFLGLLIMSPLLLLLMLLIWLQDFRSPFYSAPRIGRGGEKFGMIKFRSMIVGADKTGVDSTAVEDQRITPVGRFIRRYKLDEFPELWNVLRGEMSLVGPRPNVERDVKGYTDEERRLLEVRPGITDLSSIVFSDEGDILTGSENPDLKYNQVIRPWKSRLGLLYVDKVGFVLDLQIIYLTLIALFSRRLALSGIQKVLKRLGANGQLLRVAQRKDNLSPFPPPGSNQVVETR
jgi:lipopolysaccharide/colanic/teichoic acid biosynthesis glycosyltransferase